MYQEVGLGSRAGWTPEVDVRIANPPPALLAKYTVKEKTFYYDYASFVVRLIQSETVTGRIHHGSYSQFASQISLYPLRIPKDWIREEGIDLFRTGLESRSQRKLRALYEISESAVSTMIHEILHVKFQQRDMSRYGEEALVRKLERQFMQRWEDWILVPVQQALALTKEKSELVLVSMMPS